MATPSGRLRRHEMNLRFLVVYVPAKFLRIMCYPKICTEAYKIIISLNKDLLQAQIA